MSKAAEALALVRKELGGEWRNTVCVHGDECLVLPAQREEFSVIGLAPVLVKDGQVTPLSSSPLSWPSWYLDTADDDLEWVVVPA